MAKARRTTGRSRFQPLWAPIGALLLALPVLLSSPLPGAEPALQLSFSCPDCPGPFITLPRSRLEIDFAAVLSAGAEGVSEIRGWTITVVTEGGAGLGGFLDSRGTLPPTAGAVEGAFHHAYTWVPADGSECEGRTGVVSSVALPPAGPFPDIPPSGQISLLNLSLHGGVPELGGCTPVRLSYAEGCQGNQGPVVNSVTLEDRVIVPSLGELHLEICPPETCVPASLNTIIQARALPQSSRPFEGLLTPSVDERAALEIKTPLGRKAQATFYAAIVSQDLASGVQGWGFSISVRGMKAIGGGLRGTAAQRAYQGGFARFEIVDPSRPGPGGLQGEGFVSVVILSQSEPVTLLPTGTATVIEMIVESADPQGQEPIEAQVDWVNGLTGRGKPDENHAFLRGDYNALFCACQGLTIRSVPADTGSFLRADANGDGRRDLADPIFILVDLFLGGPLPLCREAADCNDDGLRDLSDALYSLSWLFLTGPPPPGPLLECGLDPDSKPESCPLRSNGDCP